jgi:hypothetical protein
MTNKNTMTILTSVSVRHSPPSSRHLRPSVADIDVLLPHLIEFCMSASWPPLVPSIRDEYWWLVMPIVVLPHRNQ